MKLRRVLAAAMVLCLVLALWVPVRAGALEDSDVVVGPEPVEGQVCQDPGPSFDGLPLGDLEDMGKIVKVLSAVRSHSQVDSQTAALLTALRPFLQPQRQQKLDRALRLAGLSKAAQEVLRGWKAGEFDV